MPRAIYITKKIADGRETQSDFDATLNLNLSIQFQYINGAVQTEEREEHINFTTLAKFTIASSNRSWVLGRA